MVDIAADLVRFVAGGNEEGGDFCEAVGGGQVERGVRLVFKVGIVQEVGVVADDSSDEEDVVEMDCSPEAGRGFNPIMYALLAEVVARHLFRTLTSPHGYMRQPTKQSSRDFTLDALNEGELDWKEHVKANVGHFSPVRIGERQSHESDN